jgi:hypothetical protein
MVGLVVVREGCSRDVVRWFRASSTGTADAGQSDDGAHEESGKNEDVLMHRRRL